MAVIKPLATLYWRWRTVLKSEHNKARAVGVGKRWEGVVEWCTVFRFTYSSISLPNFSEKSNFILINTRSCPACLPPTCRMQNPCPQINYFYHRVTFYVYFKTSLTLQRYFTFYKCSFTFLLRYFNLFLWILF